ARDREDCLNTNLSLCSTKRFSFLFDHTPPIILSTLSLHDALPIFDVDGHYPIPLLFGDFEHVGAHGYADVVVEDVEAAIALDRRDRKSTRLNSSHLVK